MQKNFSLLQQKGVFHPYGIPRHVGMMVDIFSGARRISEIANDINQRADSKPHPIHTVVLSDEDICTRPDPGVLTEFQKYFDVTVILLMRRQDLWLESWYSQNVKWQWNPDLAHLSFETFLARRDEFFWIHYDRTVQTFEQVFGAGNVICRPFEPEQMPDGPVMAFCHEIGVSDFTLLKPPEVFNRSLSPMMTEFMRTLPLDVVPEAFRQKVEHACASADIALKANTGPQGQLLMDHETRAQVLQEYAAGNAAVAQRCFGRDQLFLAPLPTFDAPLALRRLPDDSYDTVKMIVAPFVTALVTQMIDEAAAQTALDAEKQD